MAMSYREPRPLGRDTDMLDKLRATLHKGGVLGDEFGIPRKNRETLYAFAYDSYSKGQYEKARQLFAQLALFDHKDPRYMKGLAAASQMLGDYEQALQVYALVVAMDMADPTSVMHAGDCYQAIGKHAEAAESFDLARSMCSTAEHEPVRRRCEQLLLNRKQRV